MTNEQLVQNYRNGDQTALAALLKKNRGLIYSLIPRGFSEDDREDLAQDARVAMIDAAATGFDFSRKVQFVTFVYWRIRSVVSGVQRRRSVIRRHVVLATDFYPLDGEDIAAEQIMDQFPAPATGPQDCLLRDVFTAALRILPARLQSAVTLHVKGYSLLEIGTFLGVTRERARQLLKTSLSKLQNHPAIIRLRQNGEIPLVERGRSRYNTV